MRGVDPLLQRCAVKTLPLLGATVSLFALAFACGGETKNTPPETPPPANDAAPPDAGPELPDGEAPAPLTFGPCTRPYTGECANVDLPLDPDNPNGDTIDIFVTRFRNPPNARGAIWLLQGGPGGSVASFEYAVDSFAETAPDLAVYGVEHRGIARSSSLECGNDVERCGSRLRADLGDKLSFYSTSGAANDLHELIVRTRKPGEDVFVYGVSYGTYWAQRYLMMFPNEPTGVVLDSVVPMKGLYFSQSDAEGELTARYWAEVCDADAFCSSKMGGPAMAKMQSAFGKIGTGHCPNANLDHATSTMFRALLPYNELAYWILPVAYRYDRCTDADAAFINQLMQQVSSSFNGGMMPARDVNEDSNDALYFNVAFSELWEKPAPSLDVLEQRYNDALLPSGGIYDGLGILQSIWPVYEDRRVGIYPESDVPVLAMNGTLDSQTPLDEVKVLADFYKKPNQTFVTIPYANHGVAISYQGEGMPCGGEIMKSFLQAPRGALATSCVDTVTPPSTQGLPEYNQYVFGIDDLWEGTYQPEQPRRQWSAAVLQRVANARARASLLGSSMRVRPIGQK